MKSGEDLKKNEKFRKSWNSVAQLAWIAWELSGYMYQTDS